VNQLVAFAELFDKLWDLEKVVAVVRISHDDKPAACGGNAAHQSISVSFVLNVDYACSQTGSDILRAVGAAIVGNNYLTLDSMGE
jgi:hypothetical protein